VSLAHNLLVANAQNCNRVSYEIASAVRFVDAVSPSVLGASYLETIRKHLRAALELSHYVEQLNPMPAPVDE
jgi:hypothetical protein